MHIESNKSGHWTDDRLIAYLYAGLEPGVDPEHTAHLQNCNLCRSRLQAFERRRTESSLDPAEWSDVTPAFLAEQRRRIYNRLEEASAFPVRGLWRWASAGTAVAAVGVGLVVFTEHRPWSRPECKISDAQLAQEVSTLSLSAEAAPAAPLKALFE